MARYSQQHKAKANQRIVRNAAERFRRDGIAAVGLRQLMADAGMTHGGFYSHFASRDALVAEVVDHAAQTTLTYLMEAARGGATDAGLEALVDAYLSLRHRDNPALGCAAAALAAEVARESEETRRRFLERNDEIVELIASLLPPGGTAEERADRATAIFAGMIGTLQLMRIAVTDKEALRIAEAGRTAARAAAGQDWGPPSGTGVAG